MYVSANRTDMGSRHRVGLASLLHGRAALLRGVTAPAEAGPSGAPLAVGGGSFPIPRLAWADANSAHAVAAEIGKPHLLAARRALQGHLLRIIAARIVAAELKLRWKRQHDVARHLR